MKIFILTIVVVLVLSLSSSTTANTLVLINQANSSKVTCVTCHETLTIRIEACVIPGNETSILLPKSTTSDPNAPSALCFGKHDDEFKNDNQQKVGYFIYYSRVDYEKNKNKFVVKVNDTGFYRSNEKQILWQKIVPKKFIP